MNVWTASTEAWLTALLAQNTELRWVQEAIHSRVDELLWVYAERECPDTTTFFEKLKNIIEYMIELYNQRYHLSENEGGYHTDDLVTIQTRLGGGEVAGSILRRALNDFLANNQKYITPDVFEGLWVPERRKTLRALVWFGPMIAGSLMQSGFDLNFLDRSDPE